MHYVDHPLIRPNILEDRSYQSKLSKKSLHSNTLVCLPTGLGKTAVSILITASRLHLLGGKILLLAPTKPLVNQHTNDYKKWLNIPETEIVAFTGGISPKIRADLWNSATVIISTPQVIQNDLIGGRISLENVVHCTFDECHRATGNYAYTYIAKRYNSDASNPLVTGLSASPGDNLESILGICSNLGISETEIMTEDDPEVAPFSGKIDVEWARIDLNPEIIRIRNILNDLLKERLKRLQTMGVIKTISSRISEQDLRQLRSKIQSLIDSENSDGYEALSLHAELRKIKMAINYVETQSTDVFRQFIERQENASISSGSSKATKRFVSDKLTKQAKSLADQLNQIHPKFRKIQVILAEELGINKREKVIIFTESRDTADSLTTFLSSHFKTRRFVGQNSRDGSSGMSQKQQQQTILEFKNVEFNVLVSTSVAEEGLDIPDVDLVIFFEPVPTAIRTIQRKGRTGRGKQGKVIVLVANDTRDEAYFWISKNRQKRMQNELKLLKKSTGKLQNKLTHPPQNSNRSTISESTQPELTDFTKPDQYNETPDQFKEKPPQIKIIVDQRELNSSITRELSIRDDIQITLETLVVGDYILSDRVAVERKTIDDFLSTLVGEDRSLFDQIKNLSKYYSKPILIIEGDGSLYNKRNIHPNAIRGSIASLAVNFGASVLRTSDELDTAEMLAIIAKREQFSSDRPVTVHGSKTNKTLSEQQEYVISSIAEIGPTTARNLLESFGSVEGIMTASLEQLQNVKGIGKITAERIKKITSSPYLK